MIAFLFSAKGRLRRRDYVLGGLFLIVAPVVFAILGMLCVHFMMDRMAELAPGLHSAAHGLALATLERFDIDAGRAMVVWAEALAMLLPLLAVGAFAATWSFFALTAKRLHDVGWSGWLSALVLLPGIGAWMVCLVMILVPGQKGANRYGPEPRPTPGGASYAVA